jgi:hypothetical protein
VNFVVVPEDEVGEVLKRAECGQCVTCGKEIIPNDGGFYCYECDPREELATNTGGGDV